MPTPNIADLKSQFYGGGTDQEYDFLRLAVAAGLTSSGVLTSSGRELGYVESGPQFQTTSATPVDVTGVTLAVTVGTRPILVSWGATFNACSSGTQGIQYNLVDVTAGVTVGLAAIQGVGPLIHACRRLNPAAGARTYKVQTQVAGGATLTLSSGGFGFKYIHVVEC